MQSEGVQIKEIPELLLILVDVTKSIGRYMLEKNQKIEEVDNLVLSALKYFGKALEKSPGNMVLLDYQASLHKYAGELWANKIESSENSSSNDFSFVTDEWRKAYKNSLSHLSYSMRIYRELKNTLNQPQNKLLVRFSSFTFFQISFFPLFNSSTPLFSTLQLFSSFLFPYSVFNISFTFYTFPPFKKKEKKDSRDLFLDKRVG